MTETHQARFKRLYMRSIRRGIKEMDLILTAFASAQLDKMSEDELTLYDQLLAENDHDIYGWINGQFAVPAAYKALIGKIAAGAQGITRPSQI